MPKQFTLTLCLILMSALCLASDNNAGINFTGVTTGAPNGGYTGWSNESIELINPEGIDPVIGPARAGGIAEPNEIPASNTDSIILQDDELQPEHHLNTIDIILLWFGIGYEDD